MFDKINYMEEIKQIKNALNNSSDNDSIIKLSLILKDLEAMADDMASYIIGYSDSSEVDFLKQNIRYCLNNNNYDGYINNFKNLIHLEHIALICSTQTPDEKRYFLEEYAKYKDSKDQKKFSKVR